MRRDLRTAATIFPFDDRFHKQAAYVDFALSAQVDPVIALEDIDHALRYDPYAPDVLQAKIWFSLKAGKQAEAQEAAGILWRTEGCIDCWMKKQ